MGWYEKNIGYSRESRNYYRNSVLADIKEGRVKEKKQSKYSGIFAANLILIVITLIAWFASYNTLNVELATQNIENKDGIRFEVVNPGTIHEFRLELNNSTGGAKFERNVGVLVDIYGPDDKRIYSFYKNLWWYRAASDDSGKSSIMKGEIILNEKGKHRIQAFVVDDESKVGSKVIDYKLSKQSILKKMVSVRSVSSGKLYYFYLFILEIAVLVAFLIFGQYLGNFRESIDRVKAKPMLLLNAFPLLYTALILSILGLIIYWNYLGIGYAGYQDYLHSPNWFFSNDDVIYIG